MSWHFRRAGTIPFPESLVITATEDHDLSAFKYNWGDDISQRSIFDDKIYTDAGYFNQQRNRQQHIRMFTPIKGVRGQSTTLRQMDKAYNDLFSSAVVSRVRQPVESFFNWLIEKTTIQKASKVRSTQGLLLHMMGKIAIAFIYLIF